MPQPNPKPDPNAPARLTPQDGPPRDPQSSFEPRTGAGVGQQFMKKMVGNFEVTKTISPPGKDPVVTKGRCKQHMIHKGLFLQSDFTFFEKDGSKTSGIGTLGFDAKTGVFTSSWTDSRSTRISLRQSQGQFDGESIVLHGKSRESGTDARHSRTVAKLEDGGRKLVHRQYNIAPNGDEHLIMELSMVRR